MKYLITIAATCMLLLGTSASAEKPSWAGSGKPSRNDVESHVDGMKNKHKDRENDDEDRDREKKNKKYKDRDDDARKSKKERDEDDDRKDGKDREDEDRDEKKDNERENEREDDREDGGRDHRTDRNRDAVRERAGVSNSTDTEFRAQQIAAGDAANAAVERSATRAKETLNQAGTGIDETQKAAEQGKRSWKFWQN